MKIILNQIFLLVAEAGNCYMESQKVFVCPEHELVCGVCVPDPRHGVRSVNVRSLSSQALEWVGKAAMLKLIAQLSRQCEEVAVREWTCLSSNILVFVMS